ncbi:ADP-ribosylglycohydrolase family protein [Nocardia vinacea]|uniref:ADP-ribosylglycohydrolase family protein n=1 Tax=Nocardia vinacea TaxID=96468 RepID=UPI0034423B77
MTQRYSPTAIRAAGCLRGTRAAIIAGLSRGADLGAGLDLARTELTRHDNHDETSTALAAAIDLAARGGGRMPAPEDMEGLGLGWIGPEALAIGVFATLVAEKVGGTPEQIFRNGILFAVNHSGDSDYAGASCGRHPRHPLQPPRQSTRMAHHARRRADHRTLSRKLLYRIRPHSAERRLRCADGGVVFRGRPTGPRWRPVVGYGRREYPATARRAHRPRPN